MGSNELKSTSKRSNSRQKNIGPPSKRRNIEIIVPNINAELSSTTAVDDRMEPAIALSPINITDLSDECLEQIFERLNLQDLVNLATSNKWLSRSAASLFRHWHGHKIINLEMSADEYCTEIGNMLMINGLRQCLRTLRCFGPYISNIGLRCFENTSEQINFVTQYLNQYCAETLKNMTFIKMPFLLSTIMQKPFQNVQQIYINESQLVGQLSHFNDWFPNLRRLELVNNTFEPKCANVHLPHLQEFRFFAICHYRARFKLNEYLSRFLKSNAHLRSFQMDIQMVNEKYVLKFYDLMLFMKDNSTITILESHYSFGCDITMDDLNFLAKTLPSLEQIDFRCYTFVTTEIISFIQQMKSLKFIRFGLSKHSIRDQFRTQLNDEWQLHFVIPFTMKSSSIITLTR